MKIFTWICVFFIVMLALFPVFVKVSHCLADNLEKSAEEANSAKKFEQAALMLSVAMAIKATPRIIARHADAELAIRPRTKANIAMAIEDYTLIINADPTDTNSLTNRGSSKNLLGDKAGAIEDYTAAFRLNKKDILPILFRGSVKESSGDTKGAFEDYKFILEVAGIKGLTPTYKNAYEVAMKYSGVLRQKPSTIP